jgi:hypothetical protein
MIISKLFPRSMQCDRPQVTAVLELRNNDVRKAVGLPPEAHADANEAEFERLLVTATADDLRYIVRDLRKRLAGAEFAARTNADTVRNMWRSKGRG